jgi:REase_DpnII-MboI
MPCNLVRLAGRYGSCSMLTLQDIRDALRQQLLSAAPMPVHVAAFSGSIAKQSVHLKAAVGEGVNFAGQARHPEHVAALGFGAHAMILGELELQTLREEIEHLAGRSFFAAGRPPRFEVDGIALLGVALGARVVSEDSSKGWLSQLLERSAAEVTTDTWQLGLVRLARVALGEKGLRIMPPDLAVAASSRGLGEVNDGEQQQAWKMTVELTSHTACPGRDAVRLAVFESDLERLGQVRISTATREDLVKLLQDVGRGMKRWTFEHEKRTSKSQIARWDVENEYHVQNLLWAVLAPVFPDLDDEENLPRSDRRNREPT